MDYVIGKLPGEIEVQIWPRIRPDSKTYHDQHITHSAYLWQNVISDAIEAAKLCIFTLLVCSCWLDHGSHQTLKPTTISTSLLFTIGRP